jgi:hypothetical protein
MLFLLKQWNFNNRLNNCCLLIWLFSLIFIFLNHIIFEDKLMHDITRSIINSMHILVFKGTQQHLYTIRLKKDDIVYYMSSLHLLRQSFDTLFTICSLFLPCQVNLLSKSQSLSGFKE